MRPNRSGYIYVCYGCSRLERIAYSVPTRCKNVIVLRNLCFKMRCTYSVLCQSLSDADHVGQSNCLTGDQLGKAQTPGKMPMCLVSHRSWMPTWTGAQAYIRSRHWSKSLDHRTHGHQGGVPSTRASTYWMCTNLWTAQSDTCVEENEIFNGKMNFPTCLSKGLDGFWEKLPKQCTQCT